MREPITTMNSPTYSSSTSNEGGSTFRPQLTSLIDVMTILLVFLIKSFSVEGHIVTPSPDLQLPLSSSNKPPRPACTIEITQQNILSEGQIIASTSEIEQSESLLVPPLHDWMVVKRAQCADTTVAPEVLIQSDREMPFAVVKRVMYTCSKAGFSDFSVLVLEEK